MITITVRYGISGEVTKEYSSPVSIGDIVKNPNVKALLGYPDNVNALIDGEITPLDTLLDEDTEIVLEKKAAEKA